MDEEEPCVRCQGDIDDEDVIFIVAKDTSWGIEGDPEDASKVGAFLGQGAKKKVAAKYKKIADDLKSSGKSLKSKPLSGRTSSADPFGS